MRFSILVTGILAAGVLAIAGCGGDSDDTVVAEPTEAPAATKVSVQTAAATVAPAAGPADLVELPAHFEGTGPTDTARFNLKGGAANFNIFHYGAEKFVVVLMDSQGTIVSLVAGSIYAPVIGAYDGTKTVRLIVAGSPVHFLQITADGNWSVDISQ